MLLKDDHPARTFGAVAGDSNDGQRVARASSPTPDAHGRALRADEAPGQEKSVAELMWASRRGAEILWLAPGRPCQHQEMTVVQPGQGRPLNPEMTLKVGTHELPHGSLSVVEGIVAPRQFIGPHTHSREDEVTLVLEGQIVALVDDTVVEVNAGSLLLKPAGVMHAFGNPGPEPARVHELHAPGGLEEFYAAMHLNYSDPHLTGEQKHAAFLESCKEFGLVHHLDLTDEVRRRLDL